MLTAGRPIKQLPWELSSFHRLGGALSSSWRREEYPVEDGDGTSRAPPPLLPSLDALEKQLCIMWALADDINPAAVRAQVDLGSHQTSGGQHTTTGGVACDVILPVGSALFKLGSTRWRPSPYQAEPPRFDGTTSTLTFHFQLAFLSPKQNPFLRHPPSTSCNFPIHLRRLLGFTKPGQVLNKAYLGPGSHEVLPAVPYSGE